ncbi:BspA family leucine-rich repeat surface protein [Flavivirga eckloniae]|uniref:PKD domain-containing protein n=1 Tax=Flavivirga eckloniae TaxID=1803846 RepID=A0A2K9PND7_9FLAO|nr:BspA family leucine-rich repeat surface protein [Flavivirga eckloniae]AUP78545.1 hypothetical protein C1H87_07400 [Flavivirga eckloniae]
MNIFRIPLITLLLMFITSCSKEDVKRSNAKELIAFSINDIKATVNQQDSALEITLPAGTDKTSLKAEVELSDKATITPDPAVSRDYTNPVEFTVTAEDGSTQKYTVTVKNAPPTAFITTWKTTEANESILIPIFSGVDNNGETEEVYNYSVDWGDGSTDTNQTGSATHSYATAGTYTVSITGDFPRIYFPSDELGRFRLKIQSVENWGSQVWTSMNSAFYNCENLVVNAVDTPNLSKVTDMGSMFLGAANFNQDISKWDVSKVTTMSYMFMKAANFNQDLSKWNVSKVTTMVYMFSEATSFNQDLSNWDVSNVTNMGAMFSGAISFNQDLSKWDVSEVTDMSVMFYGAANFNQDLNKWDVSKVTNMIYMFYGAANFNQDLSKWDVSKVVYMEYMLTKTNLSAQHYDTLLEAWSKLTLRNGVKFSAANSTYCNGEAARQKLINDFGWTITDGGKNCN